MKATPKAKSDPTRVAWDDVASFVRQLAHDVRNDLNALELEIALLGDPMAGVGSAPPDFSGLRSVVRNAATRLRHLSARVDAIAVRPTTVPAADLLDVARERIRKSDPADPDEIWNIETADVLLECDIALLAEAVVEIVINAIQFRENRRPIEIAARPEGSLFRIDVLETKRACPTGLGSWETSPLAHVRRGHYGLGLYYAARIISAHGGTIERAFDPVGSLLKTSILLPVQPAQP